MPPPGLLRRADQQASSAFYPDLEKQIAGYAGVEKDNIVIGSGAAPLIEMLFNLFARKNLILAHPSFSAFEFLCKAYGIRYKRWGLDLNMDYNIANLPEIDQDSIVVLASPNNPTGTSIKEELLSYLLDKYSDTLFIVDEVYAEFSDKTLERLIKQYSNLILIRSFSKAFGLAGVRIGYLICPEQISRQLKKVILPFVLNHFSEIALKTILSDNDVLSDIRSKISKVVQERDKMVDAIRNKKHASMSAFKSHANFLLVKFFKEKQFQNALEALQNNNIKVLNLSHIPDLSCSMRITTGTPDENEKMLNCLLNS